MYPSALAMVLNEGARTHNGLKADDSLLVDRPTLGRYDISNFKDATVKRKGLTMIETGFIASCRFRIEFDGQLYFFIIVMVPWGQLAS